MKYELSCLENMIILIIISRPIWSGCRSTADNEKNGNPQDYISESKKKEMTMMRA